MPTLCERERCSGCEACRNACPVDAISTSYDDEGFATPQVDASKCVSCGRCERACPILTPLELRRDERPNVYACWNNDLATRLASSSGGLFSAFAETILAEGGVVFGAIYDDSMKVVLSQTERVDELAKFRSSKYAQAEVGAIYRAVASALRAGRLTLFVGTPCQVAGLYGYLRKDYANLFTCDLVCHGAPSPLLFDKWLRYLERSFGGRKIVALNMRDKERGGRWNEPRAIHVQFENGERRTRLWKSLEGSYVSRMFLKNICLRSSCSQCPFARFPRVGDVTLGDFWGLGKTIPFDRPFEEGASLALANSSQGTALIAMTGKRATWIERTLDEAKAENPSLYRPSPANELRAKFLRDAATLDFATLMKKYRRELFGRKYVKLKFRAAFKRLLGR